ncbi:DUF3168 domain-containing protein [Devosia sp. 2618]|uniref:DUF3168 domain-containing protein n=1 Tax=Devosia sp. 2618 TaxID=3156454 RepID=UPI00339AEA75
MDASFELILAAINRLRATPAVTSLVGTRIYDRVPEKTDGTPNVAFPYISMGPSTSIPDDFDCMDGEEITIQFDVWSSGSGEAFGSVECRKITGAMKRALHDVDLTLTTNALVSLTHEMTRTLRDPNPAITHGVIQFTATVETP